MAYPEVPLEIRAELDGLRSSAAEAFQLQHWRRASELLGRVYSYLLSQQEKYQARFHKGWELYNLGVALLNIPDYQRGVKSILLACVEDALSTDLGNEDSIDQLPAGFIVQRLAGPEALNDIKRVAREYKQGHGPLPLSPDEVLQRATLPVVSTQPMVEKRMADEARKDSEGPKRRIAELTGPRDQRCFVGGNYYAGGPNLEPIRRIVSGAGLDPIVARDFEIETEGAHYRSLLLLHHCRRAIFEVTVPAGQLMELERCRDYDITPFLLRHTLSGSDPMVSEMVASMANAKIHAYSDPAELEPLIGSYLRS